MHARQIWTPIGVMTTHICRTADAEIRMVCESGTAAAPPVPSASSAFFAGERGAQTKGAAQLQVTFAERTADPLLDPPQAVRDRLMMDAQRGTRRGRVQLGREVRDECFAQPRRRRGR